MCASLGRGVSYLGRRATQEDRHCVWEGTVRGEWVGVYAVFDGHGGALAAEYCQRELLPVLFSHAGWGQVNPDMAGVLRWTVERLEVGVLGVTRERERYDGTTLCCVVIRAGRGWWCNVGDSRCVLVRTGGEFEVMSRDHRVREAGERGRVVGAGGVVRRNRLVGRVKDLELSRALGDREFKEGGGAGLVATPEVGGFRIGQEEVVVMVGTDGLWDIEILGNEGVCEIAVKEGDVGVVAGEVVREALRWRNGDNVSLVLVRLGVEAGLVESGERGREPVEGFGVGRRDFGSGRGVYWEGEVRGGGGGGMAGTGGGRSQRRSSRRRLRG